MKMKEICARSGLTERAIRLYCERGLVHPEKYWEREREYLVFSEHNLRELAVVSELRRAEFTLDEIALMLESPERCGDVLAGWRGRVAEQNQRLTQAKDKLSEVSAHDRLSAEALAALLGAKITPHGAAPYQGETFAEFCERETTCLEYSEQMQKISRKQDRRERFGRMFLILYAVLMGAFTAVNALLSFVRSQNVLPALIQVAVFVLLTVFLFRGATWARAVSIVRHLLSAVLTSVMIPDFLPGVQVSVEHVTMSDGTVETIVHRLPTALSVTVTVVLCLAVLLDLTCACMLWFHRGVKDYLHERSL